jgi:hypothetical protein
VADPQPLERPGRIQSFTTYVGTSASSTGALNALCASDVYDAFTRNLATSNPLVGIVSWTLSRSGMEIKPTDRTCRIPGHQSACLPVQPSHFATRIVATIALLPHGSQNVTLPAPAPRDALLLPPAHGARLLRRRSERWDVGMAVRAACAFHCCVQDADASYQRRAGVRIRDRLQWRPRHAARERFPEKRSSASRRIGRLPAFEFAQERWCALTDADE